jgi:hypothetical protein
MAEPQTAGASRPGRNEGTDASTLKLAIFWMLVIVQVDCEPWNLASYELCRHEILADIPNEASDVSYSQVTNSLWVITRRPQAVFEYSLSGEKLRQVSHSGLSDPEGKLMHVLCLCPSATVLANN